MNSKTDDLEASGKSERKLLSVNLPEVLFSLTHWAPSGWQDGQGHSLCRQGLCSTFDEGRRGHPENCERQGTCRCLLEPERKDVLSCQVPLWVIPITGPFSHTSHLSLTVILQCPFGRMKEGLELELGPQLLWDQTGKACPFAPASPPPVGPARVLAWQGLVMPLALDGFEVHLVRRTMYGRKQRSTESFSLGPQRKRPWRSPVILHLEGILKDGRDGRQRIRVVEWWFWAQFSLL